MKRRLEDLDFSDDLALLSHQIKDIKEKTNRMNDIGKKLGLMINTKKTKLMMVQTRKGGSVSIGGEELKEVE